MLVRNGSNENIRRTLHAARMLTILAEEGEAESTDDGCVLLFGVVRDSAYKIRAQAEREREVHRIAGSWDESGKSKPKGAARSST